MNARNSGSVKTEITAVILKVYGNQTSLTAINYNNSSTSRIQTTVVVTSNYLCRSNNNEDRRGRMRERERERGREVIPSN